MQAETELKIQIPKGFQIDTFDQEKGIIKFKEKPKDVLERIKTVADLLDANGLTQLAFDSNNSDQSPDVKAYKLLKMLATTLNEGWTPDWNNDDQAKWYAWFYMGGSSGFRFFDYDRWLSFSVVGSRLCFKSKELAEHAGKNFTEVYKQFMTIN